MALSRWLLAAVLLGATACAAEQDDRPASWSYIVKTILRPNCATSSCHSHQAATSDVQLDDPDDAYVSLVGRDFVVPSDPTSMLLDMLRGNQVTRMPPDQPLPDADIALIEKWILAGAPSN